jgi:hypothetical protein
MTSRPLQPARSDRAALLSGVTEMSRRAGVPNADVSRRLAAADARLRNSTCIRARAARLLRRDGRDHRQRGPAWGPDRRRPSKNVINTRGDFAPEPDMDRCGLTFNPHGFLKRVQ